MKKNLKSTTAGMTFRADSFDAEAMTVEVVYATATPVGRGRYREILEISESAIDTERLDAGVVHLIRDHIPFGDHYGRVVSHRIEDGQAVAVIQLSDAEDKSGTISDIQSGVIRSVSVGYMIQAYEESEGSDGVVTRTVTRWMPYEISLTPIPADVNAAFRSSEDLAEPEPQEAAKAGVNNEEDDAERSATATATDEVSGMENEELNPQTPDAPDAVAAERSRVAAIRDLARRHGLGDEFLDAQIDSGATLDAARSAALDAIASRAAPAVSGTRATIVRDERETLATRAESALLSRVTGEEPAAEAREMRGMSMVEMARRFAGDNGAMSASRAVSAALSQRGMHGTSDFGLVLSNVVNKSLRSAYERAPRTFTPFVRIVEHTDLKGVTRVQLGEGASLKKVEEGGEYEHGTMGQSAESYKLEKFGEIIAITEEMIINDDLSAFTRLPEFYGAAAADLEAELVYGVLNANEKMSDGKSLFHAGHGNLLTASGLNIDAIAAVRAAGRKQRGLDGKLLNIMFANLIVGEDLELAAEKVLGSIAPQDSADFNPFMGKMQLVVDPRVSAGRFFASASPSRIDTIELAFLGGQRGLQTETRMGWEVDGVQVKAKLRIGAKAIDHRGLIRTDIDLAANR